MIGGPGDDRRQTRPARPPPSLASAWLASPAPAAAPTSALPAYLPEPPAVTGRAPVGLAERWRRLDQLTAGRQPARRGALPGPAGAPYRVSTAHSTEITFRRAVEVPFACAVEALLDWWRVTGRDGALDVGHCRLSGPARSDQSGPAFHMEARIGRGLPWLTVNADMELFPWLGTFGTQLTLCPRRNVHPGRHYFATGHALLDVVVSVLQGHGGGPAPGSAPGGGRAAPAGGRLSPVPRPRRG